jgi:hypothetical protein
MEVGDTNARSDGTAELTHGVPQPRSERPRPDPGDQPPHLGAGCEGEVGEIFIEMRVDHDPKDHRWDRRVFVGGYFA